MSEEQPPLEVDEENEERANFAGMSKDEIKVANTAIREQKSKSAKLSGDLSAKLEVFEKKGGHKSAMKTAAKVADMESKEGQDWVRSFLAYIDALGVNDQADLVEHLEEQDRNQASIDAATVAAEKSKPKMGAEAAIH